MAKNKKEMTPEERLAAALVPEEEQPYRLPEGWKWVYLGKMCQFIGGGTPSKSQPKYWNGDIPWASIKDVKGDYLCQTLDTITKLGVENSATNICPRGSLIVATRIEPGKTIIANIDTAINQDLKYIQSDIDVKFLHRYFQASKQHFISKSSGSTVLGIKVKVLQESLLPLPSQSEQQRIVARIESLFAKLDAAKAKVQAVLDAHETRKAALLDEAFRGKLTETLDETSTAEDFLDEIYAVKAQLVKEKKIKKPKRLPSMTDEEKPFEIPNTWRWVRFGDILRIINGDRGKNYPSKKELHEAGDIPFISALNIQDNTIATEHLLYVDEERYNLLRSGKLKKGDLVLCIRGSLGKNGRYPFDRGAIASSLVIIRSYLDNDAMSDYISFYLDSLLFKNEMSKYDNGTAQPNLGAGDLSLFAVPLPPLAEQHEIVAILDRLLGREEEVRQSAESVLAAIDGMKQSILARAFRGELGA